MPKGKSLPNCIQIYSHFVLHVHTYIYIRYTFLSNYNIHKSSRGLCFWASDPLIDRFYLNLSIKGSEDQKQRPH